MVVIALQVKSRYKGDELKQIKLSNKLKKGDECESGVCYVSKSKGEDIHLPRCSNPRLIAVTGTDLGYNDFHMKIMDKMQATNNIKSCGQRYNCPDKMHECETRCYLFDTNAILIVAPAFIKEKDLEEKKYSQVNLGIVEGEVATKRLYDFIFFSLKISILN